MPPSPHEATPTTTTLPPEAVDPRNLLSPSQLEYLLTAGRPELKVPSRSTVARDLKAVYERSADHAKKLLKDGRLTTVPLSPRPFISSTRSHTGEVLAREFDNMLRRFGLERRILAWTGDSATSNDTQNTALDRSSENNLDAVNRVRCTMNIAVKAFMRPFQPRPKKKDASGKVIDGDNDANLEEPIIDLDLDNDNDNDNDPIPDLNELSDTSSVASDDVDGDAFDDLGAQKQAEIHGPNLEQRRTRVIQYNLQEYSWRAPYMCCKTRHQRLDRGYANKTKQPENLSVFRIIMNGAVIKRMQSKRQIPRRVRCNFKLHRGVCRDMHQTSKFYRMSSFEARFQI
ncbi:hypothetical protein B0H13DRAFT_1850526 [Mycena leptocephala]|nr:hypothetical protein B0H13DRAFT_1850526 [Mycena leptocephala]